MGTGAAEAAAGRGRPVSKPARQGQGAGASLGPSRAEALTSALCPPRPLLPGPTPGRQGPQPGPPEPQEAGGAGQVVGARRPGEPPDARALSIRPRGARSSLRARPQACVFPAPAPCTSPAALSLPGVIWVLPLWRREGRVERKTWGPLLRLSCWCGSGCLGMSSVCPSPQGRDSQRL